MKQTENTAIVLRFANYRDNDRMLTLLSPTRGRLDVMLRNCRKPKSQFLNAGELTCGVYLLNLVEAVAEPEQEQQELFMLLLHTLSRLTFSDQEWKPLLAGFLLHFSACQGSKPRLNHCVFCGRSLTPDEPVSFDIAEGGLVCPSCKMGRGDGPSVPFLKRGTSSSGSLSPQTPLSTAQVRWLRMALASGSASWVNTPEAYAPFSVLRPFVESRLGRRIKSALLLPKD